MNFGKETKKKLLLFYIGWYLTLAFLRLLFSILPGIKEYYYAAAPDLTYYQVRPLFEAIYWIILPIFFEYVPLVALVILIIAKSGIRKFILFAGPIFGIILIYLTINTYRHTTPSTEKGYLGYFMILGITTDYWQIASSLFPFTWALLRPAKDIAEIIWRTLIPSIAIWIMVNITASIIYYPSRTSDRQFTEKIVSAVKEYKSQYQYFYPSYLPKKVLKNTIDEGVNLNNPFSDTVGLNTYYSCKGRTNGFMLFQGPIILQQKNLDAIYNKLMEFSIGARDVATTVEKIRLNDKWGAYEEWKNDRGHLFFEIADTRLELTVYPACLDDSSKMKEEMIKVANSMNL